MTQEAQRACMRNSRRGPAWLLASRKVWDHNADGFTAPEFVPCALEEVKFKTVGKCAQVIQWRKDVFKKKKWRQNKQVSTGQKKMTPANVHSFYKNLTQNGPRI